MAYRLPSDTSYVSCSWQCHKNRNPPSTEPGTDYASPYGSNLYAVGNGRVVDIKTSNTNATGRYITIDLDDGRRTRSLHLASISVSVGQRVTQGQIIGKTGASGYGSDYGYGAHVHQTLWATQSYNFCSTCTIDFARYVGTDLDANQRVVGSNGANGRENPNTSGNVTQTLPPGTVADFNGWKNGESVEGNKVWFRGEYSGDWFWSGGFTSQSTSGLENLNTSLNADQRQAVADGANGRAEPKTSASIVTTLGGNEIGTFDGWITGQSVEGNSVWFRGKSSQAFFWSGGFTDKSTKGLTDLNPTEPVPDPAIRTVGANSSNVRSYPSSAAQAVGAEDPGTDVLMKHWAAGETVGNINVWFQRESDNNWMWAGGFTSDSTAGLTQITAPVIPPTDNDNPRRLTEYTPIYPRAFQGLEAPLGFTDCQNPVTRTPRNTAGSPPIPVTPVIDTYIIHWTAVLNDQMDWFSYCNSRYVCPTWYMRRDGSVSEMIRPGAKPAATGPNWNWRSVTTETLAGPGSDFTDEQWEEHAQIIAWLAEHDGMELDGVPVEFKIDRTHVKGHRECLPGTTECPGDAQIDGLDALLERAQAIYDEKHPPVDPCEDCECPDCPDPVEPVDYDKIAQVVNDEHARRMQG